MSNCLLVNDEKILLLDSGSSVDADSIETTIRVRFNRSVEDIDLIAVSHLHLDHVGSVIELAKRSGANIAVSKGANLWYSGLSGKIQAQVDRLLAYSHNWFSGKKFMRLKVSEGLPTDNYLQDYEPLPNHPEWRALAAPGHTDSCLNFYNLKRKILYSGDTVLSGRKEPMLPFPVYDKEAMKRTLTKLSNLAVETIYSAHGSPIRGNDLCNKMSRLIERVDEKPQILYRIIRPLSRLRSV